MGMRFLLKENNKVDTLVVGAEIVRKFEVSGSHNLNEIFIK